MTLKYTNDPGKEWPYNPITEIENSDGAALSEEEIQGLVRMLRVRGAKLKLTLPTLFDELGVTKISLTARPEVQKSQFSAEVFVSDQGSRGELAIVRLKGPLVEPQEARLLKQTMQNVKTDGILFDLSEVKKINDEGYGQFCLECANAVSQGRTVMVVESHSSSVNRHFAETSMNKRFSTFPNQEAALNWFRTAAPIRVERPSSPPETSLHA